MLFCRIFEQSMACSTLFVRFHYFFCYFLFLFVGCFLFLSAFTFFRKQNPGVFADDDVTHIDGSIDPVRDLETIHEELCLKDLDTCGKAKDILEKFLSHKKDKKKTEDLVCLFLLVFCS